MKRYVRNMTIQQFEALIRIAEEGSFSRAAKVMCLTQPSITKHIQKLEEIVGSAVVKRASGGAVLTAEGKVVLDYARKIFGKMDEMEERVDLVRNSDSGTITLAASTIPATYILPAALSAFRKGYPHIRCFVRMNDSDVVQDMVLEGESEIGFIGRPPVNKKIHGEPLWDDHLVLILPGDHRWKGRESVTWEEIASEPFVSREAGSATRATLERFLTEQDLGTLSSFKVIAEMGSSESVKEAVAAGLGIAFLSRYAVRRACETENIVSVAVDGPSITRGFYVICRKQLSLQRHHRLFLDFIRRYPSPSERE